MQEQINGLGEPKGGPQRAEGHHKHWTWDPKPTVFKGYVVLSCHDRIATCAHACSKLKLTAVLL